MEVLQLEANKIPPLFEIKYFIASMEELYPCKYQQYMLGEAVALNIQQLKNDQRLCDWLR